MRVLRGTDGGGLAVGAAQRRGGAREGERASREGGGRGAGGWDYSRVGQAQARGKESGTSEEGAVEGARARRTTSSSPARLALLPSPPPTSLSLPSLHLQPRPRLLQWKVSSPLLSSQPPPAPPPPRPSTLVTPVTRPPPSSLASLGRLSTRMGAPRTDPDSRPPPRRRSCCPRYRRASLSRTTRPPRHPLPPPARSHPSAARQIH